MSSLEILTAAGEVVRLQRRDEDFNGAVVSLGALGAVIRLTLDLEPSFTVRQHVFEHLPFDELSANFNSITASAYSVSVFTDWAGDTARQVWVKSRTDDQPTMFSAADGAGAVRQRNPYGRGQRALARSGLRARHSRVPLHLEAGPGCGGGATPRDRGRAV